MVEEFPLHEEAEAGRVITIEADVFVEIEGDDVVKRQAFLAMEVDEFVVKGEGDFTAGEA